MTKQLEFLKVNGNKIVNESDEEVRLRGFCLGSWMNLEAFMVGFPGTETAFRKAVANVLGIEKAVYFFERFLHYFAGEADFQYLNSLGCNLMRVAFNYRHFEEDDKPFEYKPEGFAWFDKVIGWARNAGVYVSLDFHACPGWQSSGWHCDNPGGPPQFWGQKHFEDRAVALWEAIAERYKDEPVVAMYGIMNEPEADDAYWLNHYYQRVAGAIRWIDNRHILNFEGNKYSQDFSELDPPPDQNAVYSSHLYVLPGLDDVSYPGPAGDEDYDRRTIERIYKGRRAYCVEYNVPHWISEFGVIYNSPVYLESKMQVMADFLDIIESYEDHWTIWNYKDIGKMGFVTVKPDSSWMQRIQPVHKVKTDLRCDSWIDRTSPVMDHHLQGLALQIQTSLETLPGEWGAVDEELSFMVCDRFVSRLLLPTFAEQFRGMSEEEIDQMMCSFAFENCNQRGDLAKLIQQYTE